MSNLSNTPVSGHFAAAFEEHDSAIIMFIFGSCAVGALTRRVIQGLNLRLPYTVVLLVIGVLFGLLSNHFASVHVYARVVETNPHLLLSIFLPVLIFESAFAMEVHTFFKAVVNVLVLAIPGLALASFLTAILVRYLFTYDWDWNVGMMFGSILSATDPVAVVALLREVGASKQLAMVIEGEALLNDGSAIVFYNVFLKLVIDGGGLSGGEIVLYFIRVAIGGPCVGFATAKVTLYFLSQIFNDAIAEITITLASTYITYYIVEDFFGMSGILAVVVFGITMNCDRTTISPEVDHFLHRFWESLAYLANTLIFIIVGIVISEKAIFEIHGIDWFYMFALYFGCFVIRGFVIGIFSPILRHTGYGLTWQEGMVMTWGGLRGAVGLALALQVAHHSQIDQKTIGIRVLIHVSGVVFLTLLVNATTMFALLKGLGMSDLSTAKRMAMANAVRHIKHLREKTLNMLKTDRFLADSEWETVEKQTELVDPYKTTDEEAQVDDSLDIKQNSCCPECDTDLPHQYTINQLHDMKNEAILRMLNAEKLSYWRQFEHGMLSSEATRKLQECTENAADHKGRFINIEEIKKSWEIPNILLLLKRVVKRSIGKTLVDLDKNSMFWSLFKAERHKAFYIVVYTIIVIDMINVALSISSEYYLELIPAKNILRSLNLVFLILYIVEFLLKVVVQRKAYLKNYWHHLCIVIVAVGIVDAIVCFILPTVHGEYNSSVHITIMVFLILRTIRVFRLLEPMMPYILTFIDIRMSQHLSYGFDVGRGYVNGEEDVRKLIDHMSDHKEIAKSLKQRSDNSRLEVIRCLGLLSKQHPDIALSIKTRQAVRSVLNQIRDCIRELMSDGVLEETEGLKLEKIVEEKMKRLQSAPPSLPIPPPDKMLRNVQWLRNDPDLIEFIKEKAKLLNFMADDIVLREGDPAGGIFIIISGMVRLESTNMLGKPNEMDQSSDSFVSKICILDFMTSGNIIGEMSLLTHNQRSATVVCETSVQMIYVSIEDMDYAMEHFKTHGETLEYRLWHVCASRIAVTILMKLPSYQGWTKETIKLRLESSYLADTKGNIFVVDSSMSEVLLICGTAKNVFSEEVYEAPCLIPWTVLKLELRPPNHSSCSVPQIPHEYSPIPVVLVVPSDVRKPLHDMNNEYTRGSGAFVNNMNQLCLRHASQHRQSVESKWKTVQNAKKLKILFNPTKIEPEGFRTGSNLKHNLQSSSIKLKQRDSIVTSNKEYPAKSPTVPGSVQMVGEECTVNIKQRQTENSSEQSSPAFRRKLSKTWESLKHKISVGNDKVSEEPATNSIELTEVLPDNLDYIEGGDIVHAEQPIVDQNHTQYNHSLHQFHTLPAVAEAIDLPDGNRSNVTSSKPENQV